MEQQTTLLGKEIINQPKLGYFPYSKMKVLQAYYNDYTEGGMSLVELKRIFMGEMSRNTIAEAVHFLKTSGFIALVHRSRGPTRRRKYYKVTDSGAFALEQMKIITKKRATHGIHK